MAQDMWHDMTQDVAQDMWHDMTQDVAQDMGITWTFWVCQKICVSKLSENSLWTA